jgi:hypothetical protein
MAMHPGPRLRIETWGTQAVSGREGGCALWRMTHPLRFSGAEDAERGEAQRMGHPVPQ